MAKQTTKAPISVSTKKPVAKTFVKPDTKSDAKIVAKPVVKAVEANAIETKAVVKAAPAKPEASPNKANKANEASSPESNAFQFGSNFLNPEFLQSQFANHSFVGGDALRQLAENSLAESKTAYARVKSVLDSAKTDIGDNFGLVAKDVSEIQRKSLALFANQLDTVLDLAKSSLGAKTVADAITAQTAHLRCLMETGVDEGKSIATLMQKLAIDGAEQMRAGLTKSMEITTKLTDQK